MNAVSCFCLFAQSYRRIPGACPCSSQARWAMTCRANRNSPKVSPGKTMRPSARSRSRSFTPANLPRAATCPRALVARVYYDRAVVTSKPLEPYIVIAALAHAPAGQEDLTPYELRDVGDREEQVAARRLTRVGIDGQTAGQGLRDLWHSLALDEVNSLADATAACVRYAVERLATTGRGDVEWVAPYFRLHVGRFRVCFSVDPAARGLDILFVRLRRFG